jgi:threonyl-tRNA synthetase
MFRPNWVEPREQELSPQTGEGFLFGANGCTRRCTVGEPEKHDELHRLRHSAAHVMAQAVMEMFPGQAKIAIGPAIEDGFYYDFDLPRPLTP